ncbi:response regulator [candidate division KSB3 bacterium]|uniref:Response regulator n=1 Tax=candidate division KSB3 bacterium TaxID=2044937 RepID=A0A9D5JXC4_9BACT|nr:response regulator [candidate division KSB3 bacterium]MBD3325879.1 response regulator [candidate division KSB3 bacterium]
MKTSDIEQGTVLVVDEQPEDMKVLIASLQACGLTILVARQGEHALDLAAQFTPDLILLDVRMPGMEGFEICRQLKAHETTRNIPIIFLITPSESLDKTKGFEVGGMDYLTKPFQPEEVIARVSAHVTIRKLQQQLKSSIPDTDQMAQLVNQMREQHEQKALNFREAVEAYEKHLIVGALAQNRDNMAKTAASLDIPLRTLYRKIKKYRL